MKCIVLGYGSIGQRHARILQQLDCRVAVVSKRKINFPLVYSTLSKALIKEKPDYIVLANATSQHYPSLMQLAVARYTGIVLVEKPLFHLPLGIPDHQFNQCYVGYNLRFHPILRDIYQIVQNDKSLSALVYVGQYLPHWRSGRDYRMSYSAHKAEGGGVLLDLSHELDYLRWFFDDWRRIVAAGGKLSSLDIYSDDVYSLIIEMKSCPIVQVQLNYLDRIHRREINIITEKYTLKADLVKQTLQINEDIRTYHLERDDTYLLQHKAILEGGDHHVCTLEEGLEVIRMIAAIEQSNQQRKWIAK